MKCTVCWLFFVMFANLSPEVKSDCYTTYMNFCYPNFMNSATSSTICSAYTAYVSCVKSACTGDSLMDTYINTFVTTWFSYLQPCSIGLMPGQTGCIADAQCGANSVCSTGTTRRCTCSTNYVAQTNGVCAPKANTYGGSCTIVSIVDSCVTTGADANAVCSAATGGTCGCKSGYTATVGAKCLLKAGKTGCIADAQCTANSVCSTGTTRTCTCSTNYVAQTTSGLCAPKANTYGGSCTIVSSVDSCVTTGADVNAVCNAVTGGTCGCKTGYTATVGAKCSGAMNFAVSVFLLVAALILTTYLQ